jgi:hypothetical protein
MDSARKLERAVPSLYRSRQMALVGVGVVLLLLVGMLANAGPSVISSPVPVASPHSAVASATPQPFNPPCITIYTGICVSIASPNEPQIVPIAPSFFSAVQPNVTTNLPLYVKSATPLNWTNAPYSGPESPLILNVTGVTWNGNPFYSPYDGSVYHSSTLSYWAGPIFVPSNRTYPWWYSVNISAYSRTGQLNFAPGMTMTWSIGLTFNNSGLFFHAQSPQYKYTYLGAWPYSPYPGSQQYAGTAAFGQDAVVNATPTAPNWNDSVHLTIATTPLDQRTGVSIGQGYVNVNVNNPSTGAHLVSTTFTIPTPKSGHLKAANITIPAALDRVAGSNVTYQVFLADAYGDWIVSPVAFYTVNGNGSFLTGQFTSDLSISTSPNINPPPNLGNVTVLAPGTPVAIQLESENPGSAIASAHATLEISLPVLRTVTTVVLPLNRESSIQFNVTLPPLPAGAFVNFTIGAYDFEQSYEVSPNYEFTTASVGTLLPSIPQNSTFFYVGIHDAGNSQWVSGAKISIASLGGYYSVNTVSVDGLAYPASSQFYLSPILAPANATYVITVNDPGFVPAGRIAPLSANVTFVATHSMGVYGPLKVASHYTVVEQGNLIIFWLNATTAPVLASPSVSSAALWGSIGGLVAVTILVVPLVRWYSAVRKRRQEDMKRVTL